MRLLSYIVLLAVSGGGLLAQTAADFFDPSVLHEIKIYMHPNDWATLRENYHLNTYYPAEMDWRNVSVTGIGIRSRGSGSRSETKPGLRVDMNRYRNDQRFLGLNAIVLDNVVQDISFVRERLSYMIFEAMNLPAPRQTFARLFVNDRYWGVYSVVEEINKDFLRRRLGEDTGWLYEYKWARDYYYDYLGDDPDVYLERFEPKTRESNPQAGALRDFLRFINQSSDAEFRERIGEFINVNDYLRFVAVEAYLAESDGQLGDEGANNFYVYKMAAGNPFVWIAWDKDVTMHQFERSILANAEKNVLFRRLIAHPPNREIFLAAVEEAASKAGGVGGALVQALDFAYTQIRAAVHLDPNAPHPGQEFDESIEGLREFLELRAGTVTDEVKVMREAESEAARSARPGR
jgi:spore coat protein CotH